MDLSACYRYLQACVPRAQLSRGASPGYQGSTELFCMDAGEPLVHETLPEKERVGVPEGLGGWGGVL
jgi:hypothetical protein